MGKKPSVIEINGNRYDAITGQLLGAVKRTSSMLKPPSTSQVIDGFRRQAEINPAIRKVAATISPVKHRSTTAKKHLTKPANTVHSRTQRSKTLMRGLVVRPSSLKSTTQKPSGHKKQTRPSNSARLSKVMGIAKNSSVKHFGSPIATRKSSLHSHKSSIANRSLSGEIMHPKTSMGSAAAVVQPMPGMITSVSHDRLERMLDEALIKADTHKQALKGRLRSNSSFLRWSKRAPTWMVVSLTAAIIVVVAGLFAWRNIPQASMKLASMRANVKASVPTYTPSGFKFAGPAKYNNGVLSITYKAGNRSFVITQQATNWDSSSLETNAVPHNSQVQTSQVKGNTVYIYGSTNNATWVNDGVRHTIQNSASLNSEQLLKIADSF